MGGPVIDFPQKPKFNLKLPRLSLWGVLAVLILLWLASGTYQVNPGEVGVVRRFGRAVTTTGLGLHWHLPWPVETVDTPNVELARRVEVGFRTRGPGNYEEIPEESLMLTGDENIVHAEVIAQYKIKDPVQFLFNVRDPDEVVRSALEASLRAVVGSRLIDEVLTTGKTQVQDETQRQLQGLLDRYESGIQVLAVQLQDVQPPDQALQAFKDVASAREQKQRLINEAQSYRNDVIPKARGEAEKILREAEAYAAEQVAQARGEAARFLAILEEYRAGQEVNRTRLYLEAMEEVLGKSEVYVIDPDTGGILPLLPLQGEGGGAR